MSSSIFAALPPSSNVFLYDADGDAIMTDANTGLPIFYGQRVRTASVSTEELDERSSKRSRSSSEEGEVKPRRGSTGTLIASPLPDEGHDGGAAPAPPAPKKAERDSQSEEEDDHSAVRNLARQMAEAVLEGEPRDGAATEPAAPPAGEPPAEEWCLGVTVADLALRLDMRHPRVVLNLLRFVSTYNELAPPGEEIHMPMMGCEEKDLILNHESVANPVPEFAAEVAELRELVERFSHPCHCYESDGYSTDPEDRRERYRDYRYYD